jgi:hypothetical protein
VECGLPSLALSTPVEEGTTVEDRRGHVSDGDIGGFTQAPVRPHCDQEDLRMPVHHLNGDLLVLVNFSNGGPLGPAGVFEMEGAFA